MNKLTIIGNLTADPVLRTTQTGVNVCSFTVAVNRPKKDGKDQGADFFKVSAWRGLGENCAKYLSKGRKVCVVGAVSLDLYTRNDGATGANLKVQAEDVEFLSSRGDSDQNQSSGSPAQEGGNAPAAQNVPEGFTPVDDSDELPF